jgi:ankyrin repeat protein
LIAGARTFLDSLGLLALNLPSTVLKTGLILQFKMKECADIIYHVLELDVSELRDLLNSGVDPNWRDQCCRTPLHWACLKGRLDIVECLLDAGASIDAQDNDGYTPLYTAVSGGHFAVTKELLKRNASPNLKAQSDGYTTPLHSACSWGRFDIVKLLVKRQDVDINSTDHTGLTPLFFAKKREFTRIADYLIQHGALE